ncbi:hypothetical protein OLX02_01710 [Novosphingobium sp. KCTC 2891]|uniref:hypothetical protein n=1 Tax=Novosphingobium sp. KCTC 2891 TaxID=2989730 RepID=UPI002223C776|nr:hypothetical protein [Novosphingobium sp. KCTC 2891]MCW1381529.1 hypothetical protein [Novosphingobium sp. KCTC 2891]
MAAIMLEFGHDTTSEVGDQGCLLYDIHSGDHAEQPTFEWAGPVRTSDTFRGKARDLIERGAIEALAIAALMVGAAINAAVYLTR